MLIGDLRGKGPLRDEGQVEVVDDAGLLFVMTYEKCQDREGYIYDIFNAEGVFIGRTCFNNYGYPNYWMEGGDASARSPWGARGFGLPNSLPELAGMTDVFPRNCTNVYNTQEFT